jgi:hypothetical protein
METIQFTIRGVSPLVLHAPRTVDPLDPITIEMKRISAKRKKTEDDHAEIALLELTAGLYFDDQLGPYLPGHMIDAAVAKGATALRRGADIKKAYATFDEKIKLMYKGPRELEKLIRDPVFIDRRPVVVGRAKVMRSRPIFRDWWAVIEGMYDGAIFDLADLKHCIELSGRYAAIGDNRPRFGRYAVEWPK